MLLRVVTVLITVFWLGSLCWLGMVVWAPPESRMAQVDTREVYDVFFGWNDSTTMTLLESGMRRGILTISGGSGVDPETGDFTNALSLSAAMENNKGDEDVPNLHLFWKGSMEFSEEMKPGQGSFSVRIPSKQLTAHIGLNGSTNEIKVRALLGKMEVFSYDSEKEGAGLALPSQFLAMGAGDYAELLKPGEIKWETKARMGKFSFGGRDLRAYMLSIKISGKDQELKVYFSEAGEPLRIETDIGLEAISEILVPLDAYRNRKEDLP